MAIVISEIDLTQPSIQEAILRLKEGEILEICNVPAGGKVDINDGNLIITYDDGKDAPCTISIEVGENNLEENEVDYHYCPTCGFRMSDVEFYSIITDVPCPGRGSPCGRPISSFHTAYKTTGTIGVEDSEHIGEKVYDTISEEYTILT